MSFDISHLMPSATSSISPTDVTIGTFRCTPEWGMTQDMICREAVYADDRMKISQRGVLVFQPGIAEFIDSRGGIRPWKPADIPLLGEKISCSFSLAAFHMNVENEHEGQITRSTLPCALVHSFMDDPAKSELERVFNI